MNQYELDAIGANNLINNTPFIEDILTLFDKHQLPEYEAITQTILDIMTMLTLFEQHLIAKYNDQRAATELHKATRHLVAAIKTSLPT